MLKVRGLAWRLHHRKAPSDRALPRDSRAARSLPSWAHPDMTPERLRTLANSESPSSKAELRWRRHEGTFTADARSACSDFDAMRSRTVRLRHPLHQRVSSTPRSAACRRLSVIVLRRGRKLRCASAPGSLGVCGSITASTHGVQEHVLQLDRSEHTFAHCHRGVLRVAH